MGSVAKAKGARAQLAEQPLAVELVEPDAAPVDALQTANEGLAAQEMAELGVYIEAHEGAQRSAADAALVQKALVAWGLVRRIDELEAQLKPLKAELGAALEGHSLVVPKVCRVSAVRSSSVSLADAAKMQQLLGERFADLVEQSVSYKPSEKLVQMSSDGDDPWAPAYRALLRVRNSLAVRIGPEK